MDENERLNRGLPMNEDGPTVQAGGSPKTKQRKTGLPDTFQSIASEALARLTRRQRKEENPIPLPWGSASETFGGGLWPGMHVLVAGTGTGKTQLALQIALHAARHGTPTAYIGLELDALQVFARLVALQSRSLKWSELYLGQCDEHALAEATEAAGALCELPLFIEEAPPHSWPASRLEEIGEALRRQYPEPKDKPGVIPMLIVLDFLQLVGPDTENKRADLRERIGQAAYVARGLAAQENAAVLLVSSTSRANYAAAAGADTDADPKLTVDGGMLNSRAFVGLGKESGEIEFAADSLTVLMEVPGIRKDGKLVALVTAKVRAGQPAWTPLVFNGTRFKEVLDARDDVVAAREKEREKEREAKRKRPAADGDRTPKSPPSPAGVVRDISPEELFGGQPKRNGKAGPLVDHGSALNPIPDDE